MQTAPVGCCSKRFVLRHIEEVRSGMQQRDADTKPWKIPSSG
jgi:hypothetical protein